MKRSVGLILRMENQALLQRRGTWNWETGKAQSFAGLLQVTAHGGCRARESWTAALFREVREELGPDLEALVRSRHETGEVVLVQEFAARETTVRTYGVLRPLGIRQVRQIRLEPQSGGIVPFPLAELDRLQAVRLEQKGESLPLNRMFGDEIEALRAFANLVSKP